ncbi:hypothetical protein [Bradyrhizobium sp. NP1]|uniref:hypothetical protein n=1 Tax=Bradyrhizobium sp. NP1 TaxID=3049772 RepID=UPI0025A66581|nr:hypothetical protein [Bradyrhizobium sp. NP1]WJR77116.1 hypothetical protein QOU61_30940 [Bradyrhizobium sp. NP1]
MLVHDGLHRIVDACATIVSVQIFGSAASSRSQLHGAMRNSRQLRRVIPIAAALCGSA